MTDISVIDGFVKNPNPALRGIFRCFKVRKGLIIAQDLRALPIFKNGELLYFAVII